MRYNDINTIIHEITPLKEVSFYLVMSSLFNSYQEINEITEEFSMVPNNVEDLNFEEWFSWN